jgi:hypothetical protein
LKKGQEFRIMIKKRILGNKFICSVDDEELHKKVKPGYKVRQKFNFLKDNNKNNKLNKKTK